MSDERFEVESHWLLPRDVRFLDPGEAVYAAMIQGFTNQMKSRRLNCSTIDQRLRNVQAFRSFTEFRYPWQWTPSLFEEYSAGLVDRKLALGTIRSYQGAIHEFVYYIRDPAYGWPDESLRRFGVSCGLICHEGNMVIHASEYEGAPEKRCFTYDELERFFTCADARFGRLLVARRKGALAALRNSVMMKVAYGWGPRRHAISMLDIGDFSTNPNCLQYGPYGVLTIRYGKAVRGGQPRRYAVFTIPEMEWVVNAVKQYIDEIRPHFKHQSQAALFLTERGTRVGEGYLDAAFTDIRDEAGLPQELTLHSLRHSFSTHQTEWGYDRAFVQAQMGHEHPSTTSRYQHVSSEFKHYQLRRAAERALRRAHQHSKRFGEADG